jgi:hypothetical protein
MPPLSLFWHKEYQLDKWYLWALSWSFQKKFDIWEFMSLIAYFGNLITDKKYIGILAKHALSKTNLAP